MKSTKSKGSVDRMRCALCDSPRSQHNGPGHCPGQDPGGWQLIFTPQTRGRTR